MRLFMSQGQYRFGIGTFEDGHKNIVIAFSPLVLNVSSMAWRFINEDISTQWGAYVDKITGKINYISLQIDWVNLNESLFIPFDAKILGVRNIIKKIAKDKRINLINTDNTKIKGMSSGTYAEISKNQVLEWFEIEERGESVYNWREK